MFYIASAQDVLDKGQSIAQEFGVDWPMLIAQAVNFVLVAFVISHILCARKNARSMVSRVRTLHELCGVLLILKV